MPVYNVYLCIYSNANHILLSGEETDGAVDGIEVTTPAGAGAGGLGSAGIRAGTASRDQIPVDDSAISVPGGLTDLDAKQDIDQQVMMK